MFNTLYLLQYNNYYNRLVKKEETLEDYMEYVVADFSGINFNLNDNISTTQIVNLDDNISADYLLVVDSNGNIVSRWFIIEGQRIRAGQYNLTLYRDTIVDYYNIVTQSPCFIEKATLPDDSPLIFNNEDITVNQIKKNEYLLKDQSDCAWLVGYYSKDKATEIHGSVPLNSLINAFQLDQDIENWNYYKYTTLDPNRENFISTPSLLDYTITALGSIKFYINSENGNVTQDYRGDSDASLQLRAPSVQQGILNVQNAITEEDLSVMKPLVYDYDTEDKPIRTQEQLEDFLTFGGQRSLIRDASGKVFQVNIIENTTVNEYLLSVPAGSLYNELAKIVTRSNTFNNSPNPKSFGIRFKASSYYMILTRVESYETQYNLGAVLSTTDAPWNIFAIPYGEIVFKDLVNNTEITTNKEIAIATANAMIKEHGGGSSSIIYDVQLLPYCPVQYLIESQKTMFADNNIQFSYITTGTGNETENVGVIFNVPTSNFNLNLFTYFIDSAKTNIEKKLKNETDKWRLTSPNYSNYFDFGVEKNGGIQYFDVDCSYKPFTPYIHINPNFSNLYGYDDNSPRGLVLGGDFSISQISDAWNQYQIQNKNFQNIFDRQIQNMEINNKYQKIQESVAAVAGTAQGTTSGAMVGAMSGGGAVGAIVGGVIGGGASLAGGIADIRINDKLRREAIDYAKDNFGYQLGNIQALPQTISKVSAFNANNKVFPILEYYSCTFEEKVAFANKVAYNGMTVMIIDSLNNYIENNWTLEIFDSATNKGKTITNKNYIKGQIIRLDGLEGEFHLANTIAKEINQGLYFNGGL